MEEEIKKTKSNLTAFNDSIDKLNVTLRPVLQTVEDERKEGASNSDPSTALSRARQHIAMSYTAASLFVMYLRTQGVDVTEHPIKEELVRLQEAFMRLRGVENGQDTSHVPKARTQKKIAAKEAAALKLCKEVLPVESDLVRAIWGEKRKREDDPAVLAKMAKKQRKQEKKERLEKEKELRKAEKRARKARERKEKAEADTEMAADASAQNSESEEVGQGDKQGGLDVEEQKTSKETNIAPTTPARTPASTPSSTPANIPSGTSTGGKKSSKKKKNKKKS